MAVKFGFDRALLTWHSAFQATSEQRGTPVPKPEWGKKHTCQSCGAKFYDMGRSVCACPKCDAPLDEDRGGKVKRSRAPVSAPAEETPVVAMRAAAPDDAADGEEPFESEMKSDDDEESDFIEDASELGEDEDDMAEVMEGVAPGKEET